MVESTKYCPRCKQTKSTSEYNKDRKRKDGLACYCRMCYRTIHSEFHHANKPRMNARCRQWRQDNLATAKQIRRDTWQKIKRKVLKHYSPNLECAYCGDNTYEKLSIDHIEADGGIDRRKNNDGGGGENTYRRLIKEGYPSGIQVLCMPCNRKKWKQTHSEYMECVKKPEKVKSQ